MATEEPVPHNEKEESKSVFMGIVGVVLSIIGVVTWCQLYPASGESPPSYLTTKLNLPTDVSPALYTAAWLLGFAVMVKDLVSKVGLLKQSFTRQENTVKNE